MYFSSVVIFCCQCLDKSVFRLLEIAISCQSYNFQMPSRKNKGALLQPSSVCKADWFWHLIGSVAFHCCHCLDNQYSDCWQWQFFGNLNFPNANQEKQGSIFSAKTLLQNGLVLASGCHSFSMNSMVAFYVQGITC